MIKKNIINTDDYDEGNSKNLYKEEVQHILKIIKEIKENEEQIIPQMMIPENNFKIKTNKNNVNQEKEDNLYKEENKDEEIKNSISNQREFCIRCYIY